MYNYGKCACISHTFFHKMPKIEGAESMDTSVFGVLKNLINIHEYKFLTSGVRLILRRFSKIILPFIVT